MTNKKQYVPLECEILIPVVRCKDCKRSKSYSNGEMFGCEFGNGLREPDWFCADGVRKDLYEGNCEECMSDCFEPWDVLWKAPDGTFKGRCDNCGFVHVFIEGHVTQYKFCPQCGEQKQEL